MAGEPKIACTVAEAVVGDLLWVCTDRWRNADANWELWPVRKVGRVWLHVGPNDSDHTWARLERERPYDNNRTIAGWHERQLRVWHGMADQIAKAVRDCSDIETLKTVAFVLGLEGPPDFSVPPTDPTPQKDRADG